MNKKLTNTSIKFLIIAGILLTALLASGKSAFAGFGISPSDVVNDHLKPGDHYEKTIIISRSDPTEDLKGKIETDLPEIDSWFKFDPGRDFLLPKGEDRFPVKVIIDVPQDAPFKKYTGALRITGGSMEEDKAGVSVIKGAKVQVELATTDLDITNLLVRNLRIEDTLNASAVPLFLYIENIGNVDTAPTLVTVDVEDLAGNKVGSFETTEMEKIPAGETKEITANFKTTLAAGEYFGLVKIYLGENLLKEEKLYFKILQEEPTTQDANLVPAALVTTQSKGNKYLDFASNNALPLAIVVAGLIIVPLFLLLLIRRRKDKENTGKETALYLAVGVLLFCVFVLVALIISTNVKKTGQQQAVLDKSKELLAKKVMLTKAEESAVLGTEEGQTTNPESQTQPQDTPVETTPPSEEVKGVSTTAEPENLEPSFYVQSPQDAGKYPVFKNADVNSEVVYVATDSENFTVLSENTDWYQVEIGNGIKGWLQKSSVKEAN